MSFEISKTSLGGVLLVKPQVFGDSRGFFLETFNYKRYAGAGLNRNFLQDNHSHSQQGVLRGLHYQLNNPQGKLVFAATGEIFDVAVDIRQGSETFGQWTGHRLSAENHHQLFVPEGFAHGFYVLSASADVIYKCTDIFVSGDDYGILWSDETIKIEWPVSGNVLLSEKDSKNPILKQIPPEKLPVYTK
jgi:dTDP-4-dehydrorhamnose 3,5-epimerase